jgi:hypothetical protein
MYLLSAIGAFFLKFGRGSIYWSKKPYSPPPLRDIYPPSIMRQNLLLKHPFLVSFLPLACISFTPFNFNFPYPCLFSFFNVIFILFSLPPFDIFSQMTSADIPTLQGGRGYFTIYTSTPLNLENMRLGQISADVIWEKTMIRKEAGESKRERKKTGR